MQLAIAAKKLIPLLDRLSPPGAIRTEQGQLRFRFVGSVLILIFVYAGALTTVAGFLPISEAGKQVLVEFCLTTMFGCFIGLALLRLSGSTAICLHTFIVSLLIAMTVIATKLGGLYSPSMPVMLLIPALATSILGVRAGIFWAMVVVMLLATFYQLDQNGIALPSVMSEGNTGFGTVMGLGTAVTVTTLIILFYEFTNRKLNQRLKEAHDDYLFQANHDPLTSLSNRRHFIRQMDLQIAKATQSQRSFALLFFDLNQFKEANDTYGHDFGDEILQTIAQRLRKHSRESDFIARWGGDEFAMLLPGLSSEAAVKARITSLLAEIEHPMMLQGQSYAVGASIGYALYPIHGTDHEALMLHADQSMYAKKRDNRRIPRAVSTHSTKQSMQRTQN